MNPNTGEIRRMLPEMGDAAFDELEGGPPTGPKHKAPQMVPVGPCSVEGDRRTHVVDPDTTGRTVCGKEVAYVGRLRSGRKTCPRCHKGVMARVEEGTWRG